MANPETATYGTDSLIGGTIVSGYKSARAATASRGMLLRRIDATNVYGAYDATGTYDVLNETDIPNGAPIVINATIAASSGTAVLVGGVLYVTDATDAALAEAGRDAVAGLEKIRAVVAADVTLASPGTVMVYLSGSELIDAGIVNDAGAALTVTAAIIENAQNSGIIIKEA
jgi:hypothetical protein